MRKTNLAVIGVGYWGKKIVCEYSQLAKRNSKVSLYAVCDFSEKNLEFCNENYHVPNLMKYPKDVIARREIDAVNICTPNETHFEICRMALEEGKHVLVEKPMTLNSDEAYKLVDLAREKNLTLLVGHIYRFNNALKKVRSLIRDGFFGDVFYLKLKWTTLIPPFEGRDIITDLAPHPFDILNFLLDDWPSKITCKAKAYRREKLEEMAYVIAEFGKNVMGHLELSWLLPEKTREVYIVGSKRSAKIDCLVQDIKAFENGHFFDIPVKRNNTIQAELEHFIDCIKNNNDGNHNYLIQNGGLVGANVVKLLEVAKRSVESGRTERVKFR